VKVISSRQTFFIKRVFPIVWLAFLGLFSIMPLVLPTSGRSSPPNLVPFVLVPIAMAAFGAVLFRKLVWDLADEVSDGGDFLLVRKGSVEDRIRLANIMNVSTGFSTRPPRLTLRLRSPGKFGDEIAFIPMREFTFNPFARNPIAEDLIRRVDAARRDTR
jgi:hypothetical protein